MKQSFVQSSILSVALAFFAMLFGSGNIVYPLSLGRDTGTMALYAMLGFFITAVFVPLLGIVAMVLYDGDYEKFFATIGKIPGKMTIFFCMLLVGPFCIIPRSVSLAHGALEWIFPSLTPFLFSGIALAIIYFLTSRQSSLLNVLGKVLGPIKLLLLSSLIVKGFFVVASSVACSLTVHSAIAQGAFEGYGTLDLLGAFFFTNMILMGLKRKSGPQNLAENKVFSIALQGGLLGCLLLGAVYAGFVIVSSFQSTLCQGIAREQLLSTLAAQLLGPVGGVLASITIAVACLTTAIALTTVFADYISKDFFKKSISYSNALYITLFITFIFSNYGFQPIMDAVQPLIKIVYPALIALALANIFSKLTAITISKGAFYGTLALTIIMNYGFGPKIITQLVGF